MLRIELDRSFSGLGDARLEVTSTDSKFLNITVKNLIFAEQSNQGG